jgi:hypothetical protein
MAQPIREFDVSKTFDNVLLTQVTGQPDTDGIPLAFIPARRTGNLQLRDQGRIQDGFGTPAPMVIARNTIEFESEPETAFSPIRRADIVGLHAHMFMNNLLWN